MTMVQELSKILPDEFTAEPRVHLGTYFEIDVCAYEGDEPGVIRLLLLDAMQWYLHIPLHWW